MVRINHWRFAPISKVIFLVRAMNEDEMATFKTSEGIRKFAADLVKLEAIIADLLK